MKAATDEEVLAAFQRLRRALLAKDEASKALRTAEDELTSADCKWRALARREEK